MKLGKAFLTAVAVMAMPMVANAVTINVYNNDDGIDAVYDSSTLQATVTCAACSVMYYDSGYLFGNPGELFDNSFGTGEADEVDWVNSVLGTMFTSGDKTGASDGTYSSSAEYVMIKVGNRPNYTIIQNLSGGLFSFTWAGAEGAGAGLSHFVEFGTTEVPEPTSLALLGLGLAGLGLSRRRKA